MKKIMKKMFVGVVAVMGLFALTACGGNNDRTLTMATSADFPPFEFINNAGEYDGFDIHMARAIADILGYDLVIQNMEFASVIAAVATGSSDIAVAAITVTDERRESVDFTNPYFETTLVAIVRGDSGIYEISQLEEMGAELTVAVQLGTTSDIMIDWFLPDATVSRYGQAPDTVVSLNVGNVDAVVIDGGVAMQFIGANPSLRILDEILAYEEYAIAVNPENPELTARINDALAELRANGELQRIYDMFFGGE